MSSKWSVDRIEEGMAICIDDNNEILNISCSELPDGVAEGCVLIFENGAFIIDHAETEAKRAEVCGLLDDLFK